MRNPSPLRYPGGKVSLTEVLRTIIYANNLQGCTYVEPCAGGVGAGIKLLYEGHVDRIIINDLDYAVYCFWNCVKRRSEELIHLIENAPITIAEWRRQRNIYRTPKHRTQLEIGFAAFFLNRCNRSGIIKNAGPIGGIKQEGKWKLDARYNREDLSNRVNELASYGDRILVCHQDAASLVTLLGKQDCDNVFIYTDPPYYNKGKELYLNHFADRDHAKLAEAILNQRSLKWVMTYDDAKRIRELYSPSNILPFTLRYSAHSSSVEGGEILISPSHTVIPTKVSKMLASKARCNTEASAQEMAELTVGSEMD